VEKFSVKTGLSCRNCGGTARQNPWSALLDKSFRSDKVAIVKRVRPYLISGGSLLLALVTIFFFKNNFSPDFLSPVPTNVVELAKNRLSLLRGDMNDQQIIATLGLSGYCRFESIREPNFLTTYSLGNGHHLYLTYNVHAMGTPSTWSLKSVSVDSETWKPKNDNTNQQNNTALDQTTAIIQVMIGDPPHFPSGDEYNEFVEQEMLVSYPYIQDVDEKLGLSKLWGVSEDEVGTRLGKAITVEPGDKPGVFVITCDGINHDLAVKIVNELCVFPTVTQLYTSEGQSKDNQQKLHYSIIQSAK